jgi:N-acetylmuramoyl-L-alanine amidase
MILRPSPNHDARPAGAVVDTLVLHYTGMATAEEALARLGDAAAKVSAHYLIEESGAVTALVAEDRRAWHAGQSSWRGRPDVNSRSIGIELVNPGHAFGYRPFPPGQMAALLDLGQAILARHPIPPRNVVGHADIAPARKEDPGELFDWRLLAAHGIGLWPDPTIAPVAGPAEDLLRRWGYAVPDLASVEQALVAFQRHFRPARCDGGADAETLALLGRLLAMAGEAA